MTATKVTMQILSEPSLELVSLAGRNPLRSDLHAAIAEIAAPYSLRADVVQAGRRVRVNVDRHGNFWWYQAEEERLVGTLAFVDTLLSMGIARKSRTPPLDRAEEVEEE